MQNEKLNIQFSEGVTKGELIIREVGSVNELPIKPPLKITMTRCSPRSLDAGDNLPMSLKYFRDAVAEWIHPGLQPGRADDDPLIEWAYAQIKRTQQSVIIEIEKKL